MIADVGTPGQQDELQECLTSRDKGGTATSCLWKLLPHYFTVGLGCSKGMKQLEKERETDPMKRLLCGPTTPPYSPPCSPAGNMAWFIG